MAGSALWCSVLVWLGVTAGRDEQLLQGSLHRITLWGGGLMLFLWGLVLLLRAPTHAALMLPAQRIGSDGLARVDYRAVAALALPLMVNSSLQAVINLTDTWFVGHISTTAMAGMAAIFWLVFFFVMLVGGIGLGVQTFVAQYEGSGRRWRAGHATWVGLWGAVVTLPLFAALSRYGDLLLSPFGLDPDVHRAALEFWEPRMLGAPLGVALWAILGFFNGISRPRITVMTTLIVGVVNAILNQVFIFEFGWGIAGSAWATNASMGLGLCSRWWSSCAPISGARIALTSRGGPTPRTSGASSSWACRWARCTRPTCSAWPCSR